MVPALKITVLTAHTPNPPRVCGSLCGADRGPGSTVTLTDINSLIPVHNYPAAQGSGERGSAGVRLPGTISYSSTRESASERGLRGRPAGSSTVEPVRVMPA